MSLEEDHPFSFIPICFLHWHSYIVLVMVEIPSRAWTAWRHPKCWLNVLWAGNEGISEVALTAGGGISQVRCLASSGNLRVPTECIYRHPSRISLMKIWDQGQALPRFCVSSLGSQDLDLASTSFKIRRKDFWHKYFYTAKSKKSVVNLANRVSILTYWDCDYCVSFCFYISGFKE